MNLRDKCLVVFGCGYVGTALARAARAAGARVTALTRNESRAEALRQAGINVVVADLVTGAWDDRIPAGPDFAVDCVAPGSAGGLAAYREAYVGGLQSIRRWAEQGERPVGTLLYTGSTSVYPQGGGAVVDEEAPATPHSPRAEILLEAEALVQGAPPAAVARWFILRLAGIYGPDRHWLLDQLRAGTATLPGGSAHRLNLAHRDDIVAAILACLAAAPGVRNRIYNVADGAPATRGDVIAWLCSSLNRPVPSFAGTGDEPVPADRIISSARLQRDLGWRPAHSTYREGYAPLLAQV